MKTSNKFITALLAMSLAGFAQAKDYKQSIQLHITPKGDTIVSEVKALCFSTTDLFDGNHCGDGAFNIYSHGAKNWRLYERPYSASYVKSRDSDNSCKAILSNQYSGRTPGENGRLDIYAEVSSKRTYSSSGNLIEVLNKYTNCKTTWTRNS